MIFAIRLNLNLGDLLARIDDNKNPFIIAAGKFVKNNNPYENPKKETTRKVRH